DAVDLVRRAAARQRDPARAQLREIARQRRLRDVVALRAQEVAQIALRRDVTRAHQLDDERAARPGVLEVCHQDSPRTRVPTPVSVNSSAIRLCDPPIALASSRAMATLGARLTHSASRSETNRATSGLPGRIPAAIPAKRNPGGSL